MHHGRVAELRWADVEDLFDVDNGILPDVVVRGTTVADWQAVLDLIRSRGWPHTYTEDNQAGEVPSAEVMLNRESVPELAVCPGAEVWLVFRCSAADTIDFDVHLAELQGPEPLAVLCGVFRDIGRLLGKAVVMTFEGHPGLPMIGYDPVLDRVVRLAPPAAS